MSKYYIFVVQGTRVVQLIDEWDTVPDAWHLGSAEPFDTYEAAITWAEANKYEVFGLSPANDAEILRAFEQLCRAYGVVSRGFKPEDITAPIDGDRHDGTEQWAIWRHALGWMVVKGKGGGAVVFGRWNAYIRTRWDFLMFLEVLTEQRRQMA